MILPLRSSFFIINQQSQKASFKSRIEIPFFLQTKQLMRELHTAPAMISQHEESEDDPDYVDISDADINSDHEQENDR